ncbi:MAG: GNAT family N-acetyltransferase [Planctomycetaceae bacterium]
MRMDPATFLARDGRRAELRPARPADAGRILDLATALVASGPQWNLPDSDEFVLSADLIAKSARRALDSANSLHLLAVADGEAVASLTMEGCPHRKMRHVAELGLGVAEGWRRQGLARALLDAAVREARRSPVLRRLQLRVFSNNLAARALYDAAGFLIEGMQREAVRIGNRYVDQVLMALSVA